MFLLRTLLMFSDTAQAGQTLNLGSETLFDKVQCVGTELTLNECLHYPWDYGSARMIIRVECPSANHQIRLNSTTPGRGRVEVLHNNVWGTVCRRSPFSSQEAQVVCKMANLPWTTAYVTTSYGPGEGPIWLSNVDCTGAETSLDECSHAGWGTATSCSHSSDAGVVCGGDSVAIHLEPPDSVLNVLLGQPISIKCVVDYSVSPVTSFRWIHSGGSYSGQTFRRTMTLKSDSGILTCNVTNVMASTRINVWYPPEVHLEPRNNTIDVAVGEDLRVQCDVDDANPSVPTFRWTHNGRTSHGSTFLKRNVTKTDQGQLTCTANNGHMMTPGRADATINVRYAPIIHLEPNQVIKAKRNGDVTVICVVDEASPPVTSYTWSHNNNISHGPVFTKADLSTSDAGNLSCSATNEQGTTVVMTKIIIKELRPSSLIGNDDTASKNKMAVIATGSVGIVIIFLLLIIIIYQRRRMHVAKPEKNTEENRPIPAQSSGADGARRRQAYEAMERPVGGAENTYCEIEMTPRRGADPAHIYGNRGFEDEENTRQEQEVKGRKVKKPRHKNEHVYENTIVRK